MRTVAQLKAQADLDDILNSSPRKETNPTTDRSLRDLPPATSRRSVQRQDLENFDIKPKDFNYERVNPAFEFMD